MISIISHYNHRGRCICTTNRDEIPDICSKDPDKSRPPRQLVVLAGDGGYQDKILQLVSELDWDTAEAFLDIGVYHSKTCNVARRRRPPCNCDPEVRLGMPGQSN